MRVFENNFSRLHLVVFLVIWACFTGWTYWIAEHGIDRYDHNRLVILTTGGTILGPMTSLKSTSWLS